jgi:hypothetical protein
VHRADIKHGRIKAVETSHIISTLYNEEESFRYFNQTSLERSFVGLNNLTSEAADVLREVLMNQRVARDLNNKGIKLCYLNGWLHSEPVDYRALNIVCIFPTRLHAKYVFSLSLHVASC